MNAPTKPASRRRQNAHWTPEEDAALRLLWGHNGARTLREKLGRTELAIAKRAKLLRLPSQSQGLVPVGTACKRLGMWHDTLYRLLSECGLAPELKSPVRERASTHYRQLVVELDQAEALLRQRDTRTTMTGAWAVRVGARCISVARLLQRRGLYPPQRKGREARIPTGVYEEAYASGRGGRLGLGPWCAAWSAALRVSDSPCAPWLLTLIAHDLLTGAASREWIEWASQSAVAVAHEIVEELRRAQPVKVVADLHHRSAA